MSNIHKALKCSVDDGSKPFFCFPNSLVKYLITSPLAFAPGLMHFYTGGDIIENGLELHNNSAAILKDVHF